MIRFRCDVGKRKQLLTIALDDLRERGDAGDRLLQVLGSAWIVPGIEGARVAGGC